MPVADTIARARQEANEGRDWRAKEILRSSLSNYGYQRELYEEYGALLLRMGDKMQAGRFLFLSIENPTPREQEAIDLYLERHSKLTLPALIASFPSAARLGKLSLYPAAVQIKLKSLGADEDLVGPSNVLGQKRTSLSNFVWLAVIVFVIACMFVGFFQIARWVFEP